MVDGSPRPYEASQPRDGDPRARTWPKVDVQQTPAPVSERTADVSPGTWGGAETSPRSLSEFILRVPFSGEPLTRAEEKYPAQMDARRGIAAVSAVGSVYFSVLGLMTPDEADRALEAQKSHVVSGSIVPGEGVVPADAIPFKPAFKGSETYVPHGDRKKDKAEVNVHDADSEWSSDDSDDANRVVVDKARVKAETGWGGKADNDNDETVDTGTVTVLQPRLPEYPMDSTDCNVYVARGEEDAHHRPVNPAEPFVVYGTKECLDSTSKKQ